MLIGRIVGWVLWAAALVAGAIELADWIDSRNYQMLSLKQMWVDIHPGTISSVQVWLEHDEFLNTPWLWDPFLLIVLSYPAWPLLGCAGGMAMFFFRKR